MSLIVANHQPDGSIFLVIQGKRVSVKANNPNVEDIMAKVREYNSLRDPEAKKTLQSEIEQLSISQYRKTIENTSEFEIDESGRMYLKGVSTAIPTFLAKKMKTFIDSKIDLSGLINFWKLLSLNPDPAVVEQLFGFLEHNGHPITEHGYFLAYKAVDFKKKYDKETGKEISQIEYDEDTGKPIDKVPSTQMVFEPFHKGPYGSIIKVGTPVTMPREECDSNPRNTCSRGLHVGSMAYVGDFGHSDRIILECLINPRNVVSVPVDYNNTKMRVCEFYPLSIATGENPDIYLPTDYKDYEKSAIEAELAERNKKRQEVIDMIVERNKQEEDILKSLY
jgi:hypothetical protein